MHYSSDSFSIDISLRHPTRDPLSISEALSIKPQGFHAGAKDLDKAKEKWTFFYTRLEIGDPAISYEDSLKNTVDFVQKHAGFWRDFIAEQGEIKIILNHTIQQQPGNGDLCFDLYLSPALLKVLCEHGIGLNIKGWQVVPKNKRFQLVKN